MGALGYSLKRLERFFEEKFEKNSADDFTWYSLSSSANGELIRDFHIFQPRSILIVYREILNKLRPGKPFPVLI